jgi:hypothetical protein
MPRLNCRMNPTINDEYITIVCMPKTDVRLSPCGGRSVYVDAEYSRHLAQNQYRP